MQSFIDRLVAGGVLGGLPTEAAYLLFMFLFATIVVFGFVLPLVTITIWLERRVWSRIQSRVGPNRVGPQGVLQGLADGVKNILKEDVIPDAADRPLFAFAPYLLVWGFIATFVVVPFSSALIVADLNVGLLYIVAIVALSAVGVLMAGGSLNLGTIVEAQEGISFLSWFVWPLFPLFLVYFISGVAETNRAPFDVAEGESEIVAGFHVEYSGIAFGLFFLAEYANMILIAVLTALFFLGGWLSPFAGVAVFEGSFLAEPHFAWLAMKTSFFMFCFLWSRATFPRYRYDQIMRLGWKVFIPITIIWIAVEGVMVVAEVGPWAA